MTHLIGPEGRLQPLLTLTRVGRGPQNELRIDEARVSRAHAQVVWDGSDWCLYDLGSRNGTTRNGEPLGFRPRLESGDRLHFAGQGPWRLVGAGPPCAFAIGPDGTLREATGGVLGIPDDTAPLVWLIQRPDTWLIEWFDGRKAPLRGERLLPVAGGIWRVGAPEPTDITWDRFPGENEAEAPPPPTSVRLQLQHSADEESIEITVWASGRTHQLGHRAHGALLLQLARARAPEHATQAEHRSGRSHRDRGWVYPELLEAELRVNRPQLNMLVYRARKHFTEVGIPDGAKAIGRQPGTAALRLEWDTTVRGPDGIVWQTDPPLALPPAWPEPSD